MSLWYRVLYQPGLLHGRPTLPKDWRQRNLLNCSSAKRRAESSRSDAGDGPDAASPADPWVNLFSSECVYYRGRNGRPAVSR